MRKSEKDAEFRPKLGGRIRAGPQRFTHSVLARVQSFTPAGQRGLGSPRGGHPKRGKGACDVREPKAFSRRAVVKARVVRMNASGRKAAALHLAYIERDGVERDGSRGQLYGAEGPLARETFGAEAPGERHQFRLIVSPEDAHELDLTEYTRTLMRQVAQDIGREFQWAAVNHYNTDNPHAHVVIRGVDLAGKELRLDARYISNGLRWRAQEIATAELGLRTELDLDKQRRREVEQQRVTSLDRELARFATPEGSLQLGGAFKTGYQLRQFAFLRGRLDTLERLGLAARDGATGWQLRTGWLETLRDMGMRGDVIKTMHRALKGDPGRYRMLEVPPGAKQLQVEGIVRRKGLADELQGTYYAVIETAHGAAYYARLHGPAVEAIQEGALVRATAKAEPAVKPSDRTIAELAQANGGVYSREAHRAEIGDARTVQVARYEGDRERLTVPVEDFLDAHERRLGRLQRMGFARRQGPGWFVVPNLLEELEKAHEKRPGSRLELRAVPMGLEAQVSYRGPTWLDQARTDPAAGLAPFGFGSELRRASEQRAEVLRRLGVDPAAPDRPERLRSLERQQLAEELGREGGAALAEPAQGALAGRLQVVEAPSGQRYAQVLDERRRRFALLELDRELEALDGRRVEVARDPQGRTRVKETGPERGA